MEIFFYTPKFFPLNGKKTPAFLAEVCNKCRKVQKELRSVVWSGFSYQEPRSMEILEHQGKMLDTDSEIQSKNEP